jgi:hypothetical protein
MDENHFLQFTTTPAKLSSDQAMITKLFVTASAHSPA